MPKKISRGSKNQPEAVRRVIRLAAPIGFFDPRGKLETKQFSYKVLSLFHHLFWGKLNHLPSSITLGALHKSQVRSLK
jgi:hypothetical protein